MQKKKKVKIFLPALVIGGEGETMKDSKEISEEILPVLELGMCPPLC